MKWIPYASMAYGFVLVGSVIFILFYRSRLEFTRGRDAARQFIRSGMSKEALEAYTDLMRANQTYGRYEAGIDSILKEQK
jgi:hypothetical protein